MRNRNSDSEQPETPVARLTRQMAALQRRDAETPIARRARQEWEEQHPGMGEMDE